jgi:hypothetical protein
MPAGYLIKGISKEGIGFNSSDITSIELFQDKSLIATIKSEKNLFTNIDAVFAPKPGAFNIRKYSKTSNEIILYIDDRYKLEYSTHLTIKTGTQTVATFNMTTQCLKF